MKRVPAGRVDISSDFGRLHVLLRREGYRVNLKRVYRLYRAEGLAVQRRRRRRRGARGAPLAVPARIFAGRLQIAIDHLE